jgi:hypothetical protein
VEKLRLVGKVQGVYNQNGSSDKTSYTGTAQQVTNQTEGRPDRNPADRTAAQKGVTVWCVGDVKGVMVHIREGLTLGVRVPPRPPKFPNLLLYTFFLPKQLLAQAHAHHGVRNPGVRPDILADLFR